MPGSLRCEYSQLQHVPGSLRREYSQLRPVSGIQSTSTDARGPCAVNTVDLGRLERSVIEGVDCTNVARWLLNHLTPETQRTPTFEYSTRVNRIAAYPLLRTGTLDLAEIERTP